MVQSAGIMCLSIYFQVIKYKMFASYSNPYAKINGNKDFCLRLLG